MSSLRISIKFRILTGAVAVSAVLAGAASVAATQDIAGHGMRVVTALGHGM